MRLLPWPVLAPLLVVYRQMDAKSMPNVQVVDVVVADKRQCEDDLAADSSQRCVGVVVASLM